ncbi:hypothetical protein [Neisseria meningitidis]|nr:hypothetical protein [Neisseria meningitidis]
MPSESLFGRRGANTLQILTLYGIMAARFFWQKDKICPTKPLPCSAAR